MVRRHAALVAEPQRPCPTSRAPIAGQPARRRLRGVEPPVSAMWPPARTAAAEPLRRGAAPDVVHDHDLAIASTSSHHPRGRRAPARRSGRAAAPGGCPRRGCPPRRARRRAPSTSDSRPLRSCAWRVQAARRRGRARASCPDAVSIVMPGEPGRVHASRRARAAASTSCAARSRACRAARRSARASSRGSQPRREASQPKSSSAGDRRVGVVAHGHRADLRAARARQLRRVEGGGDPLAPRRRAQPGEVDDVGAARRARRARAPRPRGVGLVRPSRAARPARGRAARRPPRGGRAATRRASPGR